MAGRLRSRQLILAHHVSALFAWILAANAHGKLAFRMLTGANVRYILNNQLILTASELLTGRD